MEFFRWAWEEERPLAIIFLVWLLFSLVFCVFTVVAWHTWVGVISLVVSAAVSFLLTRR